MVIPFLSCLSDGFMSDLSVTIARKSSNHGRDNETLRITWFGTMFQALAPRSGSMIVAMGFSPWKSAKIIYAA